MGNHGFKGGTFINRYKITGKLKLQSPLHIGDGDSEQNEKRLPKPKNEEKAPEYSAVAIDHNGRAYIPGSTLKGNLRSWVSQIFTAFNMAAVNDPNREKILRDKWDNLDAENKKKIHHLLTPADYLFGSHISEGKLEFENAFMIYPETTNEKINPLALSGYDPKKGTMIMKGVSINPVTGTAAKNKLYNYEAVPPGVVFSLAINGQNLSETELGMLFFALEGFNSKIYPVTLGAMGGIGFGRACFEPGPIHCLDQDCLPDWLTNAVKNGHAGYNGLKELKDNDYKNRIRDFRNALIQTINGEV